MSKRNSTTVEKFLAALELGHPVMEILRLSSSEFIQASQEELLNNPDDIGAGVVRVEKKIDTLFFDVFTTLLVKHHDDGTARYVFFGVTRDAGFIIRLSRMLFKKFGRGIYDDSNYTSLESTEKINSLARGKYITPRDALMTIWLQESFNISLHYAIDPMRALVCIITEKADKKLDAAIRSNGTIADILNINLVCITAQAYLDRRSTTEYDVLKFTDYYYKLDEPALGVFDVLKVRVFGPQPEYNQQIETNLEFTTSDVVDFQQMLPVIERLIKIYGADHIGANEIEAHEVEELHNNAYWLGRVWHLNEMHGLYNSQEEEQKIIYSVFISNDEDNNGFVLSIMNYNRIAEFSDGDESALSILA